jgi:hypothetical protein
MTDHISVLVVDGPGKGQWLALKNKNDVPYCVEVVHDEWIATPYNLHVCTLLEKPFFVAALDIGSVDMADLVGMILDGEG